MTSPYGIDPRFWSEQPCENTFQSPGKDALTMCAHHWCTRDENGETICCYCEQPRPEALPAGLKELTPANV